MWVFLNSSDKKFESPYFAIEKQILYESELTDSAMDINCYSWLEMKD